MITLVLNDPTLPDGTPDPYYDPTYTVAPWTLQYMPGMTTYADTPIVPIRAFAAGGTGFSTAPASGTPVIRSVAGPGGSPLLCTDLAQDTVTITSLGPTVVIDPATGTNVTRDYGFGVLQGSVTLNGVALSIVSWNNTTIVATVPGGATRAIMVTRATQPDRNWSDPDHTVRDLDPARPDGELSEHPGGHQRGFGRRPYPGGAGELQ
jgi:hypothetical protein